MNYRQRGNWCYRVYPIHAVIDYSILFIIMITSLGEGKACLYASRAFFAYLACVTFCLLPLPLGVRGWCGSCLWHSLDFSFNFFNGCQRQVKTVLLLFILSVKGQSSQFSAIFLTIGEDVVLVLVTSLIH